MLLKKTLQHRIKNGWSFFDNNRSMVFWLIVLGWRVMNARSLDNLSRSRHGMHMVSSIARDLYWLLKNLFWQRGLTGLYNQVNLTLLSQLWNFRTSWSARHLKAPSLYLSVTVIWYRNLSLSFGSYYLSATYVTVHWQ